jgi:hypothetical protein
MLAAFRELTTTNSWTARICSSCCVTESMPPWRGSSAQRPFELDVDELQGSVRVMRLRTVAESVEDPSAQVSLESPLRGSRLSSR